MARLDQPILPPFLFRYRQLDEDNIGREIASIRNQSLWFATYERLNDPMEGFYDATSRLQKHSEYRRAVKEILEAKQIVGICCFSDTRDNELMWTHYAADYTGICVAYRPGPLVRGLSDQVHLVRLAYGKSPPSISQAETTDINVAATKILSHKKSSWSYEREWRLLGPLGLSNIAAKGCVREISLGSRIRPSLKSRLLRALDDVRVRISQMTVSGYEHEFEVIKRLK